jgi:hypothetical protein
MAFRNSDTGHLPVNDIYNFIVENFPYYKTAKDGWKNSIRHNLSLNKCFEKIENPLNGSKKGCLWGLNSIKCKKLEEECIKCRQRDLINIRLSMARPDDLNKIERGEQRLFNNNNNKNKITNNSSNNLMVQNKKIESIKLNINADDDNIKAEVDNDEDQLLDSFLQEFQLVNENKSNIENYFDDFDLKIDSIL